MSAVGKAGERTCCESWRAKNWEKTKKELGDREWRGGLGRTDDGE
jgi:hypothetical protein